MSTLQESFPLASKETEAMTTPEQALYHARMTGMNDIRARVMLLGVRTWDDFSPAQRLCYEKGGEDFWNEITELKLRGLI